MTCTIQTLISSAKVLANRLHEHEASADELINQTKNLSNKLVSMRQYREDESIELISNIKPFTGFEQENKEIIDLLRENHALRVSLEQHQIALELIMSRYREQVSMLLRAAKIDYAAFGTLYSQELQQRNNRILEMVNVMRDAADFDDKVSNDEVALLSQLETENHALKELIRIGRQFTGAILTPETRSSTSAFSNRGSSCVSDSPLAHNSNYEYGFFGDSPQDDNLFRDSDPDSSSPFHFPSDHEGSCKTESKSSVEPHNVASGIEDRRASDPKPHEAHSVSDARARDDDCESDSSSSSTRTLTPWHSDDDDVTDFSDVHSATTSLAQLSVTVDAPTDSFNNI